MKKTLICKQNRFGGTDLLLSRYEQWLKQNDYIVKSVNVNDLATLTKEIWDVVVLPSSEIDQLYMLYKKNITYHGIIIYILGMGTIKDSYYNPNQSNKLQGVFNRYLTSISNQFLEYLYQNNSIVFTDSVGLYNNFYGTSIKVNINDNKLLIPIGIRIPKNKKYTITNNDILKCCWIGRISKDFKMKSVQNLIADLNEVNKIYKVSLTIIGEGDGLKEVKRTAEKSQLEIHYVQNIDYEEINKYFRKNVDLCIAMGTSALDSAKNSIPTIVISPIREFDTKKANYRWIFESKGYSLGEYVGEKNSTNQIKKNLLTLIEEYKTNQLIGEECRLYSLDFEENIVFNKLINYNNKPLDKKLIKHIRKYYYLKNTKKIIKKILKRR